MLCRMVGSMGGVAGSNNQGGWGSMATQQSQGSNYLPPSKSFDILTTAMTLSEILFYFK